MKTKLVKILSNREIPQLGNINGPILHPIEMSTDTVRELVFQDFEVLEVDPNNRKVELPLTLLNCADENFLPFRVESKPVFPEPVKDHHIPASTNNKKKEKHGDFEKQ